MTLKSLTHDEAVQEVYRLTPQIREYDEFMYMGVRWLPYTMFFHHKNYRSKVINTDSLGFRLSEYKEDYIGLSSMPSNLPVNLLVGGSTTLGTGATSDAATVASRLAAYTGEPWINFGGRGYNAVQEVLLFLVHQHRFRRINNVVVLSGINTLTLEGLPDSLSSDHGRYYYSYEYQHYMELYNEDLKRRTRTYASELDNRGKGMITRYLDKLRARTENPADVIISDEGTDTEARVARAADVVTNALRQWHLLLAGTGAKLSFVLQPMAYWTRSHLVAEEKEIFHAIDSCPNNFWRLFGNILGKEIHLPFARAIQSFCKEQGVRFDDMNELLRYSPHVDDYLFVDRVHFNDKGYDEVAKAIAAHTLGPIAHS
ncbi:G-D-S-L family lipolytic protein [Delftia tsuruhatensis]|jgi:hypothetical protein|uniref:SGNH/GDSL hydrolase family protein n=1 Tax=Delftia tsuruhatensis TaxID=180282 RepID=UPI000641CEFD|nr:GDSL-type esterase/lipase family protein [Delftia tsuruhatensis]KLO57956.1 G-D-S-L family lipolytic protein [Delftia tsuruhatensis]